MIILFLFCILTFTFYFISVFLLSLFLIFFILFHFFFYIILCSSLLSVTHWKSLAINYNVFLIYISTFFPAILFFFFLFLIFLPQSNENFKSTSTNKIPNFSFIKIADTFTFNDTMGEKIPVLFGNKFYPLGVIFFFFFCTKAFNFNFFPNTNTNKFQILFFSSLKWIYLIIFIYFNTKLSREFTGKIQTPVASFL